MVSADAGEFELLLFLGQRGLELFRLAYSVVAMIRLDFDAA